MAQTRELQTQWDPFFGPPVRLGDGGMGWKTDKDPRSRLPAVTREQCLPEEQAALIPNEELRHYAPAGPAPPAQNASIIAAAAAQPPHVDPHELELLLSSQETQAKQTTVDVELRRLLSATPEDLL